MGGKFRRGVQVSLLVVTGLATGAGVAQAQTGGPWDSITATRNGQPVAQAYGTFQGVRSDQGRGSRLQNSSDHREPTNMTAAGYRGAFVDNHWYYNGLVCYVSSYAISTTGGGAGISCIQGWGDTGQHSQSGRTHSASYQYWEEWWALNPTYNSGRDVIQTCEDIPNATDSCSPQQLRGSDY